MNKQRLIMESWRRFLKESKQVAPENMMLHFSDKTDNAGAAYNIVLYTHEGEPNYKPIAIGGIDLVQTREPCIPNTMYVGSIYRAPEYKGKGIGKLLYDIGFYIADTMGFGLTSDKEEGTMDAAVKNWKRMENDPEYEKRKTKAGNDTFDYEGKTPDPDDDCDEPYEATKNATDHSLRKKNTGQVASLVDRMEQNHRDHMDFIDSKMSSSKYIDLIKSSSMNLFMDVYVESQIDAGWY